MQEDIEPVEKFNFACYPGIICFNECCQHLNIALTPYDVLKMARGLKITTSEFLERYTSKHIGITTGLPVVVLKMLPDGRCPFVTEKGCSIYKYRPSPCRLYPVVRVRVRDEVQYYLLKEDFCAGHMENREWSVTEWIRDQEAEKYNEMNDVFFELISAKNKAGRDLTEEELEKIYRVCFDVDQFKREKGINDDLDALKKGIKSSINLILSV